MIVYRKFQSAAGFQGRFPASPTFERFLSQPVPSYEKLSFSVKLHAANRMHYSLQFEYAGMAMRWAIYPGPSMDPFEPRTAIQMEDYYLNSSRNEKAMVDTPGAGIMILWDEGEWLPNPSQRFRDRFKFTLRGQRLKGDFELRLKQAGERPVWKLWKVADEFASSEDLLKKYETSVRSGLTLEEFLRQNFPIEWMEELPEEYESTDHVRNNLILKIRTEILAEKAPWPTAKKKQRFASHPTLFTL